MLRDGELSCPRSTLMVLCRCLMHIHSENGLLHRNATDFPAYGRLCAPLPRAMNYFSFTISQRSIVGPTMYRTTENLAPPAVCVRVSDMQATPKKDDHNNSGSMLQITQPLVIGSHPVACSSRFCVQQKPHLRRTDHRCRRRKSS